MYKAAYQCQDCEFRVTTPRRFTFTFHRRACCPACGSSDLKRLPRRDKIETLSKRPWSLLQGLLGGRLYYCALCRLQFYDLRSQLHRRAPAAPRTSETPGATQAPV